MQESIDSIIYQDQSNKQEKILALHKLFSDLDVPCFSDFDDTMTSHDSLLYSKLKFLQLIRGKNQQTYHKALKQYKPNKDFINTIQQQNITKLIIISRNDHEFLKYFVQHTQKTWQTYGVEIVGSIGRTQDFKITSEDKLDIIPDTSLMISDMFEYQKLQHYTYFILVKSYNYWQIVYIKIYKIFYLIKFIIVG